MRSTRLTLGVLVTLLLAIPASSNTIRFDLNGAASDVQFEACTYAGCVAGPITVTGTVAEIYAPTPRGDLSWIEAFVDPAERTFASNVGRRVGACAWDLNADGWVDMEDFSILRQIPAMYPGFNDFKSVIGDSCE